MGKRLAVLHPYVCLACRHTFRRTGGPLVDKVCPNCRGKAIGLSRKFRAPARTDVEQWAKVEMLIQHGFRFFPVYDERGQPTPYPRTLRAAREFVRHLKPTPAAHDQHPVGQRPNRRLEPTRRERIEMGHSSSAPRGSGAIR